MTKTTTTQKLSVLSISAAFLLAALSAGAGDTDFVGAVRQDTEALSKVQSRAPGSEGHDLASEMLFKQLNLIQGAKVWTHEFPVVVPVLQKAAITIEGGPMSGEHPVYPIWPDLVRLQTTPTNGISGDVLYVGDASIESLPAKSMRDNIAAMEMSAYQNWKTPFSMSASALLLLGSPGDKALPPAHQALYKPRYYIPDGKLADFIRNNGLKNCRITCDAEWQTVTAKNYYVLVMPKDGAPDLPAIAIAAAYDSMSIVMGLAPGADSALDAAFLLNLIRDCATTPPARPLLFGFIDAYSINQLGMRQFLTMLAVTESDRVRAEYHKTDAEQMELYEELEDTLKEIGTDKDAIELLHNKRKYREIQRFVKDAVGPELLDTKEECGDLRLDVYEAIHPVTEALTASPDAKKASQGGITLNATIISKLLKERKYEATIQYLTIERTRTTLPSKKQSAQVAPAPADNSNHAAALLIASVLILGIFVIAMIWRLKVSTGKRALITAATGTVIAMIVAGMLYASSSSTKEDRPLSVSQKQCEEMIDGLKQAIKIDETLAEKTARIRVLNKVIEQVLTKTPVSSNILAEAQIAMNIAASRITTQAAEQSERLNPFVSSDAIRNEILAALGEEKDNPPVSYLLGIDISDSGSTMGPALYGGHLKLNNTAVSKEFTRWLKEAIKNSGHPFWQKGERAMLEKTVNSLAVSGAEDPAGFNIGNSSVLTSPSASFEIPSATWTTLDGLRSKVDTPQDSSDRMNWERVTPQLLTSRALIEALVEDSSFTPRGSIRSSSTPKWRRAWGSVVRESVSETVPRTPMQGFIVTLVPNGKATDPCYGTPGVRRTEFVYSGADGGFTFPPAAGGIDWSIGRGRVEAYKVAERGEIVSAQSDNVSMIKGTMSSGYDLNASPSRGPARLLAFPCRELNGPEFFDPRFLEPLSGYSLIDPMTGGKPKRAHFSVKEGQMWGLLLPDTRWQLILRAGTAANRMILMNISEDLLTGKKTIRKAMRTGFALDQPLPSIPAQISAQDFYTVDEWRLQTFEKAGISSKVLEEIHQETSNLLAKVDLAIEQDSAADLQHFSISALANELRAYEALLATGSDVTRGAIFLMILIVPFSVAMERLLFAKAKIGHRIGLSAAIFTVMTSLLWSFHPAFRITNQPLIIVLAFAVLLLSLFVIIMIMRKFEADLEELRSGLAESAGAQTKRGGVIGSAVWLGIANMRKRKLRTLLTGISIVLITFALLCFSSSSTYQDKRQFSLDTETTAYSGILIRQPRMKAMNSKSVSIISNLADGYDCVPRYWWSSLSTTWRLHIRNPATGKQTSMKAALGLSPLEAKLTAPQRFIKGDWDAFAQGDACFLSEQSAAHLGVVTGDPIEMAGITLRLAGTFDSKQVEQDLDMLDGQSLLPFDFSIESETKGSADQMVQEMASGAGLDPEEETVRLPADDLIIISDQTSRQIGADLRSIGIPTQDNETAQTLVTALSKILAFPMYYSTPEGVNVLVATPLIPRIPRNLITPLILAALIIFNTMLNSVAERKKEIHIYTSLGLAPVHVGMLFLAEAVTYGLMGSVFGYVAGQGMAAVLTSFDLMGGITLNYSGSSVIMTMSMVIGVVVLSSIVPAIMAGKLAAPSDEMKWVVPSPVDGTISDQLPFTISRDAAPGLTSFIYSYMTAHEEGTIGKFASANLELIGPDSKKDIIAGIKGVVWLAPYDLGVRQNFTIRIVPELDDICSIFITLEHASGQTKTWWRQNRVFLGELRRQILGWRKVKPIRILEYIEQFKAELDAGSK